MKERLISLARGLVDEGLEVAFGVAGSGSSSDLIAELEHLGVRYYSVSHEASAAIMAGAVYRMTGKISISISIKGPGIANALPGIVHNHLENVPAVSISEAYGAEIPSYQRHKRLDHKALLSSVVKGTFSLNEVDVRLSSMLDAARREIPGPVHLDLCTRKDERATNTFFNHQNPQASNHLVKGKVFQNLDSAARPVLIVGSLSIRRRWREKLPYLGIPVFTTASAKGALDENLSHSAGVFTGYGKELAPESHLFSEADLVIGIGLRNTEVLSPKPFDKPVILLDEVNGGVTDGFQADVLVTDADSDFISDILDRLSNKSWGGERIESLRVLLQSSLLNGNWLPSTCFNILNHWDSPYTLVLDTGAFCTIGEHLWKAGPKRRFLGSSNGRYMGVALPSGVGAAICQGGFPVFCVVGDGGIRTYPAEIKIAIEEELPTCFILMTDGRYASIGGGSRMSFRNTGATTVPRPSWWKAVVGMGCEAYEVKSESAFAAVLERWDRKRPFFIEAKFDPAVYAGMTRQLR